MFSRVHETLEPGRYVYWYTRYINPNDKSNPPTNHPGTSWNFTVKQMVKTTAATVGMTRRAPLVVYMAIIGPSSERITAEVAHLRKTLGGSPFNGPLSGMKYPTRTKSTTRRCIVVRSRSRSCGGGDPA